MRNAISIDLEDWFCAYNLETVIKKEDWNKCEYRLEKSTLKILDILGSFNTFATFFVLGWVADKSPELIKEIENRGHEIALHGYSHLLITTLTPEQFENDIKKGLSAIKNTGIKQDILGFRAPSFTITQKTKWALNILEKYNIKYDSSIFPVGFHPDYGIPDAPISPYKILDNMQEFPLSIAKVCGMRVPCSGGGYFRLFPYPVSKYLIKKVNEDNRPVVFYLHPWEIDWQQPRMKLQFIKKIRHYNNLKITENRLKKLLNDFQFTTIKSILNL